MALPIIIQKNELTERFEFLDALRESGATNMFGAAVYLTRTFGDKKSEATRFILAWMKSFSGAPAADRAEARIDPKTWFLLEE